MIVLPTPLSWATSIGVFESSQPNGLDEILKPPPSQPSSSSALENLSKQEDEELDELKARLIGRSSEASELSPSIADITRIPDFADALTALEWVRQWADTGYWLEADQWADFQAIAIAGYSPEIKYWLGRDRWASFGAMPFGAIPNSSASIVSASPGGSPTVYPTSASSIGGIADNAYAGIYPNNGGGKKSTADDETAPKTLFELVVSMLKKIARQPIFYLIFLTGAGLLIWAFRRQAST